MSEEKKEELRKLEKRYFHSPDHTKRGYQFLKRQSQGIVNNSKQLSPREDDQEAEDTLNKSGY